MPQQFQQFASLVPLLLMFVLLYFFMIRPQKKREKEVQTMRLGLRVGDEVLTVGGIKGKIIKAGDEYLTLETSGRTRIEFTRSAIYRLLTAEDLRADEPETKNSTEELND